jgi:hypothetical protein
MTNRREFIVQLSLGTGALAATQAMAAGPMLAESDAQATALGYKADATKVDKTKPTILRETRGQFETLFQEMGISAAPMFESSSETGAGKLELLRFIGAEVATVVADEDESGADNDADNEESGGAATAPSTTPPRS